MADNALFGLGPETRNALYDYLMPEWAKPRPLYNVTPDMAGQKVPQTDATVNRWGPMSADVAGLFSPGGAAKLAPGALAIFAGPGARKLGLQSIDNFLRGNNIPFRMESSNSFASPSKYYHVDTPQGPVKIRASDHLGPYDAAIDLRYGSDADEAFGKIMQALGKSYDPSMANVVDDAERAFIRGRISELEAQIASGNYPPGTDPQGILRRFQQKLEGLK